ncbi:MAG: DsbA family protein [Pseudomonadota bacterium]
MTYRSFLALTAMLVAPLGMAACAEDGATVEGGSTAQPPITDEEFDRMLREALMRRPEVIIEAIETFRAQMEADAESASREVLAGLVPELVEARSGHAIGASADDAEIVVVEFFDYHCGFCKRALDDVIALVDDNPSVRVVFQELPILRDESRTAALSALAAGIDGGPQAYSAVHLELMRTEGTLDQKAVDAALRRAGASPRDVARVIDERSDTIEATLDRSIEMARNAGVSGTPYFVIINTNTDDIELLNGYTPDRFAAAFEAISKQ